MDTLLSPPHPQPSLFMRRVLSQSQPRLIWAKPLTQGRGAGEASLSDANAFVSPGRDSATAFNVMHFSCLSSQVFFRKQD